MRQNQQDQQDQQDQHSGSISGGNSGSSSVYGRDPRRLIGRGTVNSVAVSAAAMAMAIGLAGCGSSGSTTGTKSVGDASSASPSAATSSSGATKMSDPATVMQVWLTNVIGGDYSQACMESTGMPTATQTSSTSAPSAAVCADPTKPIADGQSLESVLSKLRVVFTPKSATAGTPVNVQVTPVKPSGGSVTYDASDITVNGQKLDDIVVSHSTGVTAQQLDISFPLSEINGSWYVANFNMQIG